MAMKSMGLMSVLLVFVTVCMLTTRVNGQGLTSGVQLPKEFSGIWLIYDMANVAPWAAMTLNDGTLTTAVNDVMTGSVTESRRREFSSWATFDINESGAQLVAKFPEWTASRPYFISDKSIAIHDHFLLDGCFSMGKAHQIPDGSDTVTDTLPDPTIVPPTLCFSPTGNFTTKGVKTNQRGYALEKSTSASVQSGSYHIADNLISFEYADGSRLSTIVGAYRFGQQAPAFSVISIGEHIFFKQPYEALFNS